MIGLWHQRPLARCQALRCARSLVVLLAPPEAELGVGRGVGRLGQRRGGLARHRGPERVRGVADAVRGQEDHDGLACRPAARAHLAPF